MLAKHLNVRRTTKWQKFRIVCLGFWLLTGRCFPEEIEWKPKEAHALANSTIKNMDLKDVEKERIIIGLLNGRNNASTLLELAVCLGKLNALTNASEAIAIQHIESTSVVAREAGARILGKINSDRSRDSLKGAIFDKAVSVRLTALEGIVRYESALDFNLCQSAIALLRDPNPDVREKAARVVAVGSGSAQAEIIDSLFLGLSDPIHGVAIACAESLGTIRSPALARLVDMAGQPQPQLKALAERALRIAVKKEPACLLPFLDAAKTETVVLLALKLLGPYALESDDVFRAIVEAGKDTRSIVRKEAARTLAAEGARVLPSITPLLRENDNDLRYLALACISELGEAASEAGPDVERLLTDYNSRVRAMAATTYGNLGVSVAPTDKLLDLMTDTQIGVRIAALRAAKTVTLDPAASFEPVFRALEDEDPRVRAAGLSAIPNLPVEAERKIHWMRKGLTDKHADVRLAGTDGLEVIPGASALTPDLMRIAGIDLPGIRASALTTLSKIQPPDEVILATFARGLKDESYLARRAAAAGLARLGSFSAPATHALSEATSDVDRVVRGAVIEALARVGEPGLKVLALSIDSDKPDVRIGAFKHLNAEKDIKAAIPELIRVISTGRNFDAPSVAFLIQKLGRDGKELVPAIMAKAQTDSRADVLIGSLEHVGEGVLPAVPELIGYLNQEGLLRNAAIRALIGAGEKVESEMVTVALSKDALAREAAIRVLTGVSASSESTVEALSKVIESDDVNARVLARNALVQIGAPSLKALRQLCDSQSTEIQETAILALHKLGKRAEELVPFISEKCTTGDRRYFQILASAGNRGTMALAKLLGTGDETLKCLAAEALSKSKEPSAIGFLEGGLKDTNPRVKGSCINALAGLKSRSSLKEIIPLLAHGDAPVHQAATRFCIELGAEGAAEIASLLKNEDANCKSRVIQVLGAFKESGKSATRVLIELLNNKNSKESRHAAALCLGAIGPAAVNAVPDLFLVAREEVPALRGEALAALNRIGRCEMNHLQSLVEALGENNAIDVQLVAIKLLPTLGLSGRSAVPTRLSILEKTADPRVVRQIANTVDLLKIPKNEDIKAVESYMGSPKWEIRCYAATLLVDTTSERKAEIEAIVNEKKAVDACEKIWKAQLKYRMKDWDGNGVVEYAASLKNLLETKSGAEDLKLIDRAIAFAEKDKADSVYHGYRFSILKQIDAGFPLGPKKFSDQKGLLTEGFGIVAHPQSASSSFPSFYMDHSGKAFMSSKAKGGSAAEWKELMR